MTQPNPDIEKTVFPQGPAGMPSARSASELLARLNARATEPIDGLLDALCEGASPTKIARDWASNHPHDAERWQRVIQCQADLNELNQAKEQAKLGFLPGPEPAKRDAAMLAYLLVVAAGILAHGQVVSSVKHEVLDEWFTAVAGATPGHPLATMLNRAAERLRGLHG